MIPRPHYAYPKPAYEGVRQILAPPYQHLPSEEIESLLESVGINPDFAESIWSDIGTFAVNAAPTILPVLGTALGTVVGGPVGAAVGGTLGNLAGKAVGAATAPRPAAAAPRPTAPSPRPATPPQVRPQPQRARPVPAVVAYRAVAQAPVAQAPVAPAPAPTSAPASTQLLDLLSRPELAQALLAMTFGQMGAPEIPVGESMVPLGAFTNLLGHLAEQAVAEYHTQVGSTAQISGGYLEGLDEAEAALPEVRATRLLSLFQEADANRQADYDPSLPTPEEALEAYYDELEMAGFYEEFEF